MKISSFGWLLCFSWITCTLSADQPFTFPTQYSGEQTTTAEGQVIKSKFNVDGEKIRMEMTASGMEMISIIRKDLKTCYTLIPSQKMCMVVPISSVEKAMERMPSADSKLEFVGKETIRNISCDKYKMVVDKDIFFLWVDASTKMPVRQASADEKFVMDWEQFKAGPQSADLFEVPADYQKMDMNSMPGMPGLPKE